MGLITELPSKSPAPLKSAPLKDGSHPCLILNADYQPLSYYPLSLWSWQDAVKAVFLDRVSVIDQYDQKVHSANMSMAIPSVVALKEFVPQNRAPAFTRFNLFLRDGFQCVYCGSGENLTFDHVNPRRLGGETSWENIVAACTTCNLKKGGRTPEQAGMRINRRPAQPSIYELQSQGRRFPPGYLHESWLDFLYWDLELQT